MDHRSEITFGAPLIGRTERALNAILARELRGSGLTPSGWVLLKRVEASAGADLDVSRGELEPLLESGFLADAAEGLAPTAKARAVQAQVGERVAEITARLWGGLPGADLATAGRVLETVLSRASAELGYSI